MPVRPPTLQEFVTSLGNVFAKTPLTPEASSMMDDIFAALRTPGVRSAAAPRRLRVCRYVDEAIAHARAVPRTGSLAAAFAAIEPSLSWAPRIGSGPFASDNWPGGHANATIIGPNGLEQREDAVIGVSLMAPHVRYPDHYHPPEEVYLALSPGRFKHGNSDWVEPGIGGTFHNVPNIHHAMASDGAPLLAIWCLWVEQE
jgi:hypothetical protein